MDFDFKKNFTLACRERKQLNIKNEIEKVLSEEYDDLSKRADRSQIQDSSSIRGNLRARRLAEILFDKEGKLDLQKVEEAIKIIKNHIYFLGPEREEDALRQQHIARALEHLLKCPATQKLIMQFSRPDAHIIAEKVLKETLDYPEHHSLTDHDVRVAVLSAWFCYLRQSVGSCFATAPVILIQTEQPDQMLLDFKDLMETGRLKRVAFGEEIHAPLSASWGVGDFRKPIILESGKEEGFKSVGLSPGLLAAFEAVGIVDSKLSLKERVDHSIKLVSEALKKMDHGRLYFSTTSEKIIKNVLLNHFGMTEEAYQEWLNRPREMVYGSLMMTMSHSDRGQKGTGMNGAKVMQGMLSARSAFMRLAENALLKTWEFTTASFAETKGEFSTWNLYVSLGLDPEEPSGIGHALYLETKERLDRANRKVEEYQEEYKVLYSHLKLVEGKVKSAASETELRWIRADYQAKLNEFNTFEAMRNKEHYRATRLAGLFSDLINRYITLFPRYFQEVYDAEVHETGAGIWDDRPAGFRLLFKHGRLNTAQWTRIDSPDAFSQALVSFFSLTESEISHSEEFEGLEQDISSMITRAMQQVKTKEFLQSAIWRTAKKHNAPLLKDPLDHLDQIDKKPWAYTSGGNLNTLVASYFKLKESPKEVDRFLDNEIELIVFLADTLKQIPYEVTDPYKKDQYKRMLMHSPTHAFNLMPGLKPFQETWKDDLFTYTAIRDQFVYPAQHYWEGYVMTHDAFEHIIEVLLAKVPEDFKPGFKMAFSTFPGEMSPPDLAEYIYDKIETEPALKSGSGQILSKGEIASIFLKKLPLIKIDEVKEEGLNLFNDLPEISKLWDKIANRLEGSYISVKCLLNLIEAVFIENNKVTSYRKDLTFEITERFRSKGWLPPSPLIFADTNWPGYFFAMMVSPASGKFELWRVDRLGLNGAPMEEWKEWLNGSRRSPKWGVLSEPHQYKM